MTLSREVRREVLRGMKLFAGTRPEDLDALLALVGERRVRRDETVVRRGDGDASMMVVVQGRLRAGATAADGREVVMGLIDPGGVIGEIALLDGKPRSLDVVAMTDSLLLVVERRDFLPFLSRHPDLMLRLLQVLCDRLRRSAATLEDVALASLQARLARLLLKLAAEYGEKAGEGVRIRVKMSQRELSAQVAATRERVNKQLRQFREAGLVGDQDGRMVVLRPEELRRVAEETE